MDGQLSIPALLTPPTPPPPPPIMQEVRFDNGNFLDAKEGVKRPLFAKIQLQTFGHSESRIVNVNSLGGGLNQNR